MINPFDRDFFKFFVGFVCILSFSFCILYVVGQFTRDMENQDQEATVQK